jgi:hypothetical protein
VAHHTGQGSFNAGSMAKKKPFFPKLENLRIGLCHVSIANSERSLLKKFPDCVRGAYFANVQLMLRKLLKIIGHI